MLAELEKEPKKLAPIYLLGGDNDYLIEKFSRELVQKIVPAEKRSFNWIRIDENEEQALFNLQNAARTVSLLGGEKVIEFRPRGLLRGKASTQEEKFLKIIDSWPRGAYLIITAGGEIDKRTRVFKQIKKKARFLETRPLQGRELYAWIKKQVEARGKTIDQEALLFLEHAFHNHLYVIENELEKVFLFMDQEKNITRPLLEQIISMDRVLHDKFVFEWVDVISQKNTQRALEMLGEMLRQGINPAYLFIMLARQIRLLALCWELKKLGYSATKAAQHLGEHPFPIKKIYKVCDAFTYQELFFLWQEINEVGERTIRGEMEWQPSLEHFLFRLDNRKTRS